MKASSRQTSNVNPPETVNMTPSVRTTMTGILILLIPFLFFLGLFTGFLRI